MFLKLFDDTATIKLVNIGLAQSIEQYEPEKELSMKELEERKDFPEILKKGIRVIWNDQIQKEGSDNSDCYYAEQIFYGITFDQLTQLLNENQLYIKPKLKPQVKEASKEAAPVEEAPDEDQAEPAPVEAKKTTPKKPAASKPVKAKAKAKK